MSNYNHIFTDEVIEQMAMSLAEASMDFGTVGLDGEIQFIKMLISDIPSQQWIKCRKRSADNSDFDCQKKIWIGRWAQWKPAEEAREFVVELYDKSRYRRQFNKLLSSNAYWMPTGLVKPEPPNREE